MIKQYDAALEADLKFLLAARTMPLDLVSITPKLGALYYEGAVPVAACFLRAVEGPGLGMLDCLITNPGFGSDDRASAIDALFTHLIETAKSQGYRALLGYTAEASVASRLNTHGFTTLPHTVIYREL